MLRRNAQWFSLCYEAVINHLTSYKTKFIEVKFIHKELRSKPPELTILYEISKNLQMYCPMLYFVEQENLHNHSRSKYNCPTRSKGVKIRQLVFLNFG